MTDEVATEYRSFTLTIILLCIAGCVTPSRARRPINLNAPRNWTIVVAEDALPSEHYAAEELQRLYEQASGHRLPISAAAEKRQRRILVGPGAARLSKTCRINTDDFGPEDLRIVANRREIVIAGGRPRGTLYGVYTFCEKALGVRFLTTGHTHVPKLLEKTAVGPWDFTYSPPVKWRYAYYGEIHADNAFAVRLRQNARPVGPELGGRTPSRMFNHTVSGLLPWGKYGKEHPDYFCLRDGKRPTKFVRHQTYEIQPCFSHPEARRIMTDGVLKRIEREYPRWKDFSVSQADNYAFCTCKACAAKDAAAGCHTGQLLDFVNAVAAEAEKLHSDVTIGTLIYQWTRTPPKNLRPRHNVKLQLCSIECCQLHPIDDPTCPLNKKFQEDLAGWAKLTDNIAIWHYNVNFRNYLVPCPNLFNLTRNVRYFVKNHARGIFMQCAGGTTGAEFSDLRNYIICNLLWDPTRDGEELMAEFLSLHYGRAAAPIRRFIDRVHAQALLSGKHRHCFGKAGDYGLTAELGHAGLRDFEEAQVLAEDDVTRARVEKLSIAAWRLVVEPLAKAMVGDAALSEDVKAQLRPAAKTLFDLCRKHKVALFTERTKVEDVARAVAAILGVHLSDTPGPGK